jgi:hypothetical protein
MRMQSAELDIGKYSDVYGKRKVSLVGNSDMISPGSSRS